MKLSDLIQNKKTYSGTTYPIDNGPSVLQQAINKSSPSFKDTTTNQAGVPVSTRAQDLYDASANSPLAPIFRQMAQPTPTPVAPVASAQAPVVPTPEPIRDAQGNPIATPADWYAEYGYRAQNGDTNAQQWLQENVLPDQPDNSGIDFSTPTSNVAYSAEKLHELYGTKSPEDLWALRQKLRFQQSQASAGMLPDEEYMRFNGDGITDGTPRYNYDQRMGVNKATADIFGTQVSDIDKFMDDYSKGQKASGGFGGYGSNPIVATILASGKFTKEQSAAIKYAIDNGENPTAVILNNAKNIMGGTLGTKTGQLESAYTQMQGIDALLKDFYANGGDSSFFKGNYEKVLNKLGTVSDPKLVDIASQISSILMAYRNAVTGTAASVQEDAKISSIFPGIDKGETLNNALTKARLATIKREIDGNYRSVLRSDYDSLMKQEQNSNASSDSSGDRYIFNNGHKYKVNADGSATLVSFSNVGGGTNTAIAGLSDAMRRIARNESPSGNYRELGPVVTSGPYRGQRALGLYQVMPGNLPAWSKEALGYTVTPQQFLANPKIQDQIVSHQLAQIYKKHKNWSDVASVWFTGQPLSKGYNSRDVLGTSGAEYVRNFNA